MSKNQVILHIKHQFTRRLAYEVCYKKPASFRKKASIEYEQLKTDFWWLVRKMGSGWFDSVPENHKVYLTASGEKEGYLPMFYLYHEEEN